MSVDTYPYIVPFVADVPAARTTARRLDRIGYADTDHETTKAWLHDLALYEALQAKEQRMALHMTAGRVIDRDTGEVTVSQDQIDEAAWRAFVDALAAWQDHAAEGRAMIDALRPMLAMLAALPVEQEVKFARLAGVWTSLRHGPLKRPLPPGVQWRWAHSLADHYTEGFRHLIAVRQRWRVLAEPGRRAARDEFGIGEDADLLHRTWPIAAQDDLDRDADAAGVCRHWSTFHVEKRRAARGRA